MAPAQMALPVDQQTGSSAAPRRAVPTARSVRAVPPEPAPEPVSSAPADGPVVMSEVPVWWRRLTTAGVVIVAVVSAAGSYEHMRALGADVGEGWRAWMLPLSFDGLALVASMTMLVRRRSGLAVGWLPWVALVLSLGASLAANVASAEPTLEAQLYAAWAPVALFVALKLLLQQMDARGGPGLQTRPPRCLQPLRWR